MCKSSLGVFFSVDYLSVLLHFSTFDGSLSTELSEHFRFIKQRFRYDFRSISNNNADFFFNGNVAFLVTVNRIWRWQKIDFIANTEHTIMNSTNRIRRREREREEIRKKTAAGPIAIAVQFSETKWIKINEPYRQVNRSKAIPSTPSEYSSSNGAIIRRWNLHTIYDVNGSFFFFRFRCVVVDYSIVCILVAQLKKIACLWRKRSIFILITSSMILTQWNERKKKLSSLKDFS